jgi:hypothetical protein
VLLLRPISSYMNLDVPCDGSHLQQHVLAACGSWESRLASAGLPMRQLSSSGVRDTAVCVRDTAVCVYAMRLWLVCPSQASPMGGAHWRRLGTFGRAAMSFACGSQCALEPWSWERAEHVLSRPWRHGGRRFQPPPCLCLISLRGSPSVAARLASACISCHFPSRIRHPHLSPHTTPA